MMQFSPGSKVETKHLSYVVLPFFPSIVLLIDSQLYESIIFFALTVAEARNNGQPSTNAFKST